ncbi:MAG: PAS domain S-box protein [Cyclobacteriaceae bacterium]|nr:PAS domain S-box protein [Cyclobacteriaceae bacterium]
MEEKRKLLELSTRLATTLNEEVVTRLLADGISTLLRYDTMAIYVADHHGRYLTPIIVNGNDWGDAQDLTRWRIPFGQGILGGIINAARGELVKDAHLDPRSHYPVGVPIRHEQMIAIPLGLGENYWGALVINRMSDDYFTGEEFETVQFVASYASLALNNIKLIREIRETNELKQVVFDTVSDSVITFDAQGQIIFCNDATTELFGYSAEELKGRTLRSLLQIQHEDGLAILLSGLKSAGAQLSRRAPIELEVVHKDGRHIPVEVSLGETVTTGVRIFTAIIRDISARVASESMLKSANKRLENLIQTLKAGLLVEDETRHIILANQTFCEMFGIPAQPHQMVGLDCSNSSEESKDLFVNPAEFVSRIDELLKRREVVSAEELHLNDGRTFARDYVPIFVDNQYRGHLWLYRDISETKRIEQDLIHAKLLAEESMNAKQDFLARMSHELRTPIHGVLGLTNLMAAQSLTDDSREYLRGIKSSGEHLLAIINDILDLAKIEAGKLKLQQVEFRPADIFRSLVSNFASLAEAKAIRLEISYDPGIPEVLVGDPVRLNQVLMNIVSNAIKFTERGSVVLNAALTSRNNHRAYLKIIVKDTGVGIPPANLEAIFESFNQGDRHTAVKFGGTGLGLSIVKQLLELFGGHVTVTSEVGKGSTFTVELDFGIGTTAPQQSSAVWDHHLNFPGKKVLLVEDNMINQIVARKTLEKWLIQVDVAGNGREALERLRAQQDYDLIIMDVQMPEMDGFETTRAIRSDFKEPVRSLPIMAMTASVLYDPMERSKEAGMNDYISKPFNVDELNNKLAELFKVSRPAPGQEDAVAGLVNFDYLDSISDNKEFRDQMVELFDTQSMKYLTSIKQQFVEGNFESMKSTVHAFKPLGSYLGVSSLTQLLAKLESDLEGAVEEREVARQIANVELKVDLVKKELESIKQ